MKTGIIGFLLLLMLASFSFADQTTYKKSPGKPRAAAVFLDSDIIRLLPHQIIVTDIKIKYTADTISYRVYATDGLILTELGSSTEVDDKKNRILSVPVKLTVDAEGRFYIHIEIATQKEGVETKGVISKVVSSEPYSTTRMMNKNTLSNKIQILPSTETIKKKNDE